MLVLERDIETRLKSRVEELGGKCVKFASATETGIPDRIVIMPRGRIAFVELKRPKGGSLSEIQKYQIAKLRALGCEVYVLRNYKDIEGFLARMTKESSNGV